MTAPEVAPARLTVGSRPVNWRLMVLVTAWTLNGVGLTVIFLAFLQADVGFDWELFVEAGRRFTDGGLYDWSGPASYRYSPTLAVFLGAIAPIGYLGWTALHFVALLALPRRLALLTLLTFPFWSDVYNGNTMTFVFVAAVTALNGSRMGALAFLTLALLVPRPLMIPIAVWLLWTRRDLVLPFVAIFVLHAGLVLATGWGNEWIVNLVTRGTDDLGNRGDFGPSRLIGLWWYPLGLAAAAWLVRRRHFGFASLAASPYWLSHYFLMLLLEVRPRRR